MRTVGSITGLALLAALAACGDKDASGGRGDTAATTGADGTGATDGIDGTDVTTGTDGVDGTDATGPSDGVDGTDCSPDFHVDCFGNSICEDGVLTQYHSGPIYDCHAQVSDCKLGTYTCSSGCAKASGKPGPDECDGMSVQECAQLFCAEFQDVSVCGAAIGYDPTLLEAAVAEALAPWSDAVDCGCIDSRSVAVDAPSACICSAFAACTPAHHRSVVQKQDGDPVGAALVVRPTSAGSCELLRLTDWSQGTDGGAESVATQQCTGLKCEGMPTKAPGATGCE